MTTRERLACGGRMLDRIDAQRQRKGDPGIFAAVEGKIVGLELDELETEWRANSEMGAVLHQPNLSARRSVKP
ncbi:MAG TPA: hypothetical protein VFQ79_08570 [Bryobacteraceae bacterium]|nr:hypothetical protein [Bryobacteraceae bacterium]